MSDDRSYNAASRRRRGRDDGMTLPEVLIAITVLGLIVTVLSSAVIVTLRQQSSTEGRLNVARSEQSIGLWLPGDLASAAAVDSDHPEWSACSRVEVDRQWEVLPEHIVCPSLGLPAGSNALLLGWSDKDDAGNATYTNVSYYFYQAVDGTFELARVECVLSGTTLDKDGVPNFSGASWTCDHIVVLRELDPPPVGTEWVPGVTKPSWVVEVSQPLAAGAREEGDLATGQTKNANRVIVTINGGGSSAGAGGGVNRISITAGGTTRRLIDGSSMVGAPSFVEARSLCGGPMVLLVDESNSIGNISGAPNKVKQAVRDFVNAVRGTPIRLQVIGFHTVSHSLGTTGWHRTGPNGAWGYNMADESEVQQLLSAVDDLRFTWTGNAVPGVGNGGTNWEEGLFRAFFAQDGLISEPIPNKVVFFTDGIPTFERLRASTGTLPAEPAAPGPAWYVQGQSYYSTGSAYSQVAFDRADYIARQFRGPIDLIGVGVGDIATGSVQWMESPRVGYRTIWERSYRQFQHVETKTVYERAATLSSNLDFETRPRSNGSWSDASPNTYFSTSSSNRRIQTGSRSWSTVSYNNVVNNLNLQSNWFRIDTWTGDQGLAAYNAAPGAEKAAGLWRQRTTTTTTWVTKAAYEANNTTSDASDGWSMLASPEYIRSSDATDWVEWTGSRSGIDSNQLRSRDVEGVPPYDGYRAAATVTKPQSEVLARLIGETVLPTKDPATGEYNNANVANLYTTPDWNQLPAALKAIALGDCGGTLTLQTRVGGTAATDPFRYQATQQFDASGNELETVRPVVYTNREQTTGNFDFSIDSGLYRDVVIMPENYSDLRSYQPAGWTCRAGAETRAFTLVDIPGNETSPWKGIKVRVHANEAVSCIQTVTR